jgi:hypothetical protein
VSRSSRERQFFCHVMPWGAADFGPFLWPQTYEIYGI